MQSAESVDQFFYDLLGRQTNRIDAASNSWKTEYDALSRPIKTIRPSGTEEQTGYNALGYRILFTNAEGKVISFGLDAQGRVTSITNAINNVTSFDYDLNGNLVQRTDAEGKTTDYSFDEMNRLTNVIHEGTWKALFEYDLNGNNVAQASPLASLSLEYDSMNRLESSLISVNSRSFAVTNAYDLNGNRTNIVYPGGLTVSYEYDEENRLESVDLSDFGLSTFDFSYDGASCLTNIVYPNGVSGDYVYDAESRILEYAYSSGSNNFLRHVIQRDPRGLKIIEDVYEGLLPNFTNEVHQTRTHNDADQLLTAGDLTHSYNDNGCLTSSVSSAQSVDYSYDYDNRLINADGTEYLYDASGVRVARIHDFVTNYFVIDYTAPLKMPLAETDASGNITRYYIWSSHGLLCHLDVNPTNGAITATRYYHSGEQSSTLALTDETGAVTDQFAYSPYGQVLGRTGATDTPYQWLGGIAVRNEGNNLYYMLNRYYCAEQKRFISPDPKGIDGGVNLYAYGNLNPLFYADPFGLEGSESESPDGNDNWGFWDRFLHGTPEEKELWDKTESWESWLTYLASKGIGIYSIGLEGKQLGKVHGWAYAHIFANAQITQKYGMFWAILASGGKEYVDFTKGVFFGNQESLYSAFQAQDFHMNGIGMGIPDGMSPYDWARNNDPRFEGFPGPFYLITHPFGPYNIEGGGE